MCLAANPRIACVVAAVGTGAAVVATGIYLARSRRGVCAGAQGTDVCVDSSAVNSDDRRLA